jgi:1,2-diacylglycerol 3-beta-galactosyltransferase
MGQATTRLVDAYLDCGRFPVTLFPKAYAWLARSQPRLWSALYHGTRHAPDPKWLLGPFIRSGLSRRVAEFRADLVVSVLPVVNGLLVEASRGVGARTEVVLTDWSAVHRLWVAPGVDHYTTPTESARQDCIRFSAAANAIDVVGIPVRRAFTGPTADPRLRANVLSELGLDASRFTVLAMVGAEGSPRSLRNIARLAGLDLDGQLVVVCGRNDALRQRVQRLPAHLSLRALGFVENIGELMRAADVLVTKAGGLTLAEAFCSHVPVVVQDILPGQEAGNLEYVLDQQAVVFAPDPAALERIIHELSGDSARRARLAERGASLARPDAARRIARDMLARLND